VSRRSGVALVRHGDTAPWLHEACDSNGSKSFLDFAESWMVEPSPGVARPPLPPRGEARGEGQFPFESAESA